MTSSAAQLKSDYRDLAETSDNVNVVVGLEGKHREQLLLFALAVDLQEQSLSVKTHFYFKEREISILF